MEWQAPTSTSFPTFWASDTASQSLSSSTATKITFTVESWDEGSKYASSRFTPTVAGYYQVSGCFDIQPTTTANIWMKIYKNGSSWATLDERYSVGGELVPQGTTLVYLDASDYIEIYGFSTQTATIFKGPEYAYFTAVGIRS